MSDPLYKREIESVGDAEHNTAFNFMNKMAALKVKKIIQFCKHIPQWEEVDVNMQINLIKGGLTEAMVLYNTVDYDPARHLVKFMDGKERSKEAFYAAGFNPDMVNTIFSIWEYCHRYNIADSTSVALLTAACLTSPERCSVRNKENIEKEWLPEPSFLAKAQAIITLSDSVDTRKGKIIAANSLPIDPIGANQVKKFAKQIDEIHTSIVMALQQHLLKTHPRTRSIFAKALYVLVKLRDISDGLMPQQLSHFELLGLNMQPLFCEIYN